jgi:starch synthase
MAVRKLSARNRRSVLIVGSEAVPFAKTGGLADVLGALPPALARLGWDVTLALPRYRDVTGAKVADRFSLSIGGFTSAVNVYESPLPEGARAVLVDAPELFDREGLYGIGNADYPDNPRRFGLLVRAALDFASRQTMPPSIVHAHDWQAGLAPVYLKTLYANHPRLAGTPSVFTIHNIAYQGLFEPDWLPRLDLPWQLLSTDRLEYWGRISLLKGGINNAEVVTTVSPTYAREIQTPEHGLGFDGIVRHRAADFIGILNGIDTTEWDPERDPHLPARYNASDLGGKRECKREVLKTYGLPTDEATLGRPTIGMVSRMVDQKGFDLLAAMAADLPRLDANWVVLGTGERRYQDMWKGLASSFPTRIGAWIGFDERRAHLVEAGADLFLMPSRFEPCGLNQMYSLRYGTIPVVSAVGGLADTVRDQAAPRLSGTRERARRGASRPVDKPSTKAKRGATQTGDATVGALDRPGSPNGFVFHEHTPEALMGVLGRALKTFRDRRAWRALQQTGMKEDHSWDRSAQEYVKIYERALKAGTSTRGGHIRVRETR